MTLDELHEERRRSKVLHNGHDVSHFAVVDDNHGVVNDNHDIVYDNQDAVGDNHSVVM